MSILAALRSFMEAMWRQSEPEPTVTVKPPSSMAAKWRELAERTPCDCSWCEEHMPRVYGLKVVAEGETVVIDGTACAFTITESGGPTISV